MNISGRYWCLSGVQKDLLSFFPLLDCKAVLRIAVRVGNQTDVTPQIPVFQMQHSSWKSDNEWQFSSLSSGLWCILFQSCFNHNLFFICFHLFERVADGFSKKAAVHDVKTMNTIKSLYLYFLLWYETKKKGTGYHLWLLRADARQYIILSKEYITKQA